MRNLEHKVEGQSISKKELIPIYGWFETERRNKENEKCLYDIFGPSVFAYHYGLSLFLTSGSVILGKSIANYFT